MKNRLPIVAVGLLLFIVLALVFGLRQCSSSKPLSKPATKPAVIVSVSTATASPIGVSSLKPVPVTTPAKVVAPMPKPKPVATTSTGAPVAPRVELHTELIPKDITIVRCYYSQQITPPGTSFGFDINGSGFTTQFQKMITVESSATDIRIENLKLVTANQIHGDMVVGPKAATAFVYPRVLIKGLPVFSAADPFAVVRPGEVLTIIFISMEDNGRGGRFRVLTNLNDQQMSQFQVLPSTPALQISQIEAHLPFVVEGSLHIGPGLPTGSYGLSATLAGKEIFRHDGMIRIVRPNVGRSGFAQGLVAEDPFHRPGDTIQLYLQGTGLAPQDVLRLNAKVNEFDMGQGTFSYVSPVQARLAFVATSTAPVGMYGVTVLGPAGEVLYQKDKVFQIVPANWVAAVQVSPSIKPGGQSTLRILGRDFSADFAQSLKIDLDEPGIQIKNLHLSSTHEMIAEIDVPASVAPGDYWLHLSNNGHVITPPYGSLIKVESL